MADFVSRARELGLDLEGVPAPVAVYVPAVRTGNLVFTAGNTNDLPDESLTSSGLLGREVSVEQGKVAARQAGLNCIRSALTVIPDLNSIVRVIRTTGYVASADGFNDQPSVVNGASELFRELFGEEAGVGARMAVGFVALPDNAPTELEVIFEVSGPAPTSPGGSSVPDYEARARELGLDLSAPPAALAIYRPAVRTGNLVFVSGNVNMQEDGKLSHVGKVGREVSLEEGKAAARVAGINCLRAAKSAIGDLNKVVKVVRTVGFVASEDGFNDQPQVINGASELFRDVFGEEAGVGARLAMGLMELPLRAPVEVEVILEVRD